MTSYATFAGRTIVPTLRYRDVSAAIDWLSRAFGFVRHHVVTGEDGAVAYAELTFGDGMIMLAPVEGSAFDKLMTQPADTGGAETQICYLFVADAVAHCARARAAGAEIVLDIADEASEGRGYSCRDPEGHIWSFGTYDPWRHEPAEPPRSLRDIVGEQVKRAVLLAALLVAVIVSAVVGGWALGVVEESPDDGDVLAAVGPSHDDAVKAGQPPHEAASREAIERAVRDARDQLTRERSAKDAAERTARLARDQLVQERAAKDAAEVAVKDARDQLARERVAKEMAERGVREAREQLLQERTSKQVGDEIRERVSLAERAARDANERLEAERRAREAAELASREALDQLARERSARDASERASKDMREQLTKERNTRKAAPRYRQVYPAPATTSPFAWQ